MSSSGAQVLCCLYLSSSSCKKTPKTKHHDKIWMYCIYETVWWICVLCVMTSSLHICRRSQFEFSIWSSIYMTYRRLIIHFILCVHLIITAVNLQHVSPSSLCGCSGSVSEWKEPTGKYVWGFLCFMMCCRSSYNTSPAKQTQQNLHLSKHTVIKHMTISYVVSSEADTNAHKRLINYLHG